MPDFRKRCVDSHARFLARGVPPPAPHAGHLSDDWIAGRIARLDRVDGDIDTLTGRIDHVRTWTYIAHRADWLGDAPPGRSARARSRTGCRMRCTTA